MLYTDKITYFHSDIVTKSSGKRRTISVDDETYRVLVKAKAQAELEKEEDISLSQAVAVIIVAGLATYGLAKLLDDYEKNKQGR